MGNRLRYDFSFGRSEKTIGVFEALSQTPGWCKVSGGELEHPVLVRFAVSREGVLTVSGLVAGGFDQEPVTARSLRRIRVGEILGELPDTAWKKARNADPDVTIESFVELAGLLVRVHAAPAGRPRAKPGPKGWPKEHSKLIADEYRDALRKHPRNPIATLAKKWNVSPGTMRRWVRRARDRGYLGDAVPGKAGEIGSTRRIRGT
jgi:hypothetical protein